VTRPPFPCRRRRRRSAPICSSESNSALATSSSHQWPSRSTGLQRHHHQPLTSVDQPSSPPRPSSSSTSAAARLSPETPSEHRLPDAEARCCVARAGAVAAPSRLAGRVRTTACRSKLGYADTVAMLSSMSRFAGDRRPRQASPRVTELPPLLYALPRVPPSRRAALAPCAASVPRSRPHPSPPCSAPAAVVLCAPRPAWALRPWRSWAMPGQCTPCARRPRAKIRTVGQFLLFPFRNSFETAVAL
jgi:hypothetical protein